MAADQNLGAIICPSCNKLISRAEPECIFCGMKNPNLWGLSDVLKKISGGGISSIPLIAIACVGLYLLSLILDPAAIFQPQGLLGILSPSIESLYRLGGTGAIPMARGKWWSVITAIYLHGGLIHIVFNYLWIRQLGPTVEEFFGIARTFLIFTVAGILGFVVSNSLGIRFTIGASGSIFGLLGALVYYGRKRGGTFGRAIYRQTGQWALILFAFGFFMSGINNYAHAGGFVGGYLAAAVLGFAEQKKETHVHQLLGLAAVVLTLIAFLLAIFS